MLRDVLLTVVLIAGLFLATVPVIAILVISLCLSFLPGVQWERRSLGIKVLIGLGIVLVLAAIAVFYLVGSYFNQANGGAAPSFGPLATGFATLVVVLIFLVLIGTILVGYSYSMYRTFSDRLRPGASAGPFDRASEEVEDRITQVAAAQRGNMTIYGGNNPFIGTGPSLLNEDWSIAIELDRAPGVYSPGAGDPLERIDLLLRKLEADAGILEDEQAEDVPDDAQRLHTEVHSRRPSAESIRLMLSRLTKATSSTAALLATVEQIKELVSAILH